MSASSGEEVLVEPITQDNRELNIVRRFDFFTIQNGPQKGSVVLRFLGFGVVKLVGIDPNEARVGDIAVEVAHSGFYTRARVWLKVIDGARGKGIDCFKWSIAGPDPASSAGESSEIRKGDGNSSKNLRMSRSLTLFHPFFEPVKPIHEGVQSEFDG
ncbi:unnamed protein product [Sphagnum balticum]